MHRSLTIVATSLLVAFPGLSFADSTKMAAYAFSSKRTTIKGAFIVDGYTSAQVMAYVAQDCDGAPDQMSLVGKPRKKRGHVIQKFQTNCEVGLTSNYKGRTASFEVQEMDDGRTLVEIMTSDGSGNVVLLKEYR